MKNIISSYDIIYEGTVDNKNFKKGKIPYMK